MERVGRHVVGQLRALVLAALERRHQAQRWLAATHGHVALQQLHQAVEQTLRWVARPVIPGVLQSQSDVGRGFGTGDAHGFGLAEADGVSRVERASADEGSPGFADVPR